MNLPAFRIAHDRHEQEVVLNPFYGICNDPLRGQEHSAAVRLFRSGLGAFALFAALDRAGRGHDVIAAGYPEGQRGVSLTPLSACWLGSVA